MPGRTMSSANSGYRIVAPELQQWRISGLIPAPLHGAEHVHEALVLQSCKRNVFLCPAVGDAEVHENALNVQMRQRRDLLQFVQRSVVVIGKEADARHAGIKA